MISVFTTVYCTVLYCTVVNTAYNSFVYHLYKEYYNVKLT